MIQCEKCSSCVSLEQHHEHPRFMDNEDGKGLKIWLCQSCHKILHLTIIPSILWPHIPNFQDYHKSWQNKEKCVEAVKRRTLQWLQEKEF